jgi:uncharacterized protein (TIGR00730 family)
MAISAPKVPKPSDPQLVRRSQNSAREAWRMFEIIAEFVTATERLPAIQPAVAIFGSARITPTHPYYAVAEDIARRLSNAGFSVISGGGPGIMEAVNKGAFEGPSPSVGLNIQLPHEQSANAFQDVSHTFRHFFARKVMFVKLSAAFVMMPGGFGTLDELMEVLTLVQTGKIRPRSDHPGELAVLVRAPRLGPRATARRRHDRSGRSEADPGDRRSAGSRRRDLRSTTIRADSNPRRPNARPSWPSKVIITAADRIAMRPLLAVLLAVLAFTVSAQSTERPRPAGTSPLADAPPPPPLSENPVREPEVTTRTEGGQTFQEYRMKGKLYMVKVTPAHGKSYVLRDEKGDGTFSRLDQSLDQQLRVPQWVLMEF